MRRRRGGSTRQRRDVGGGCRAGRTRAPVGVDAGVCGQPALSGCRTRRRRSALLMTASVFQSNDVDVSTSRDVDARYAVVFLLWPLLNITDDTAVQQPANPPLTINKIKRFISALSLHVTAVRPSVRIYTALTPRQLRSATQ